MSVINNMPTYVLISAEELRKLEFEWLLVRIVSKLMNKIKVAILCMFWEFWFDKN